MKFDLAFIVDSQPVAEAKNITFLGLIALLVGFPRKKYKNITFIIKTSDDEIQE